MDRLTIKLQFGRYNFVVEADIKGFFDNIEHGWLMRMLGERIEDGAFLRLIRKWLKAGVLDTDGQVLHPGTGTPQGGIITPPTKLQTFFFRARIARTWIDPKHDIDLIVSPLPPASPGRGSALVGWSSLPPPARHAPVWQSPRVAR